MTDDERFNANAYDADLNPEPVPCPVCTGDIDAPPCGEDCDRIVQIVIRERRVKALRAAAKRAISFARAYWRTAGPRDPRVRTCIDQANAYRTVIRQLRVA